MAARTASSAVSLKSCGTRTWSKNAIVGPQLLRLQIRSQRGSVEAWRGGCGGMRGMSIAYGKATMRKTQTNGPHGGRRFPERGMTMSRTFPTMAMAAVLVFGTSLAARAAEAMDHAALAAQYEQEAKDARAK